MKQVLLRTLCGCTRIMAVDLPTMYVRVPIVYPTAFVEPSRRTMGYATRVFEFDNHDENGLPVYTERRP